MAFNYSTSSVMPNLLIGLCKGSRSLKQYSMIFHDQLGYEFFRFELSFLLSVGQKINPDAIIYSTKKENTLIFEWTETDDPTKKVNQFSRYSMVTSSDLSDIAAIPPNASKFYDVVIVLRKSALGNFQSQLVANGFTFPILVLDQQNAIISLTKTTNSFSVSDTDDFFLKGIQTNRIPRYIPFSLDTNIPKELIPFIIQHFVSLLAKGVTRISLPDFCNGMVPVWGLIGIEKQKQLSRTIRGLLNTLLRKKWSNQLAIRKDDNPPTWILFPDSFKTNPRGYRKLFNDFIAEVQGDTFQFGFDF